MFFQREIMNETVLRHLGAGLCVLASVLAIGSCAERACAAGGQSSSAEADEQKLQGLIHDLKSDDPKTLHAALRGIANLGPPAADAVEPLAGMLEDGRKLIYPSGNILGKTQFQVNLSVVTALRCIGKPAVEALVTALENEDAVVRLHAAWALVSIGRPIESKHWVRALSDSNRSVQIVAAQQLGKKKDAVGVEPLCRALHDENADVRVEAARALGQIGDTRAIEPLIAALSRTEPINFDATVSAPAHALAEIGKPALEVLIDRFETFDESMRKRAAIAFLSADATREKKLLLRCCRSEHEQLRNGALFALIKHKIPEGYVECKRLIDDPVWNVRYTAVRGLAEFADEDSTDTIRATLLVECKRLIDDPVWNVRYTAVRSLAKSADTDNADTIRSILLTFLREDKHPTVRDQALWSLYILPGTPPDDFWRSIAAALEDESPRVRASAVETANKFWDARLTPKILSLLKDPDSQVRAEAAGCLANHRVEDATAGLIELLRDNSPRCAERAAMALGCLRNDDAVDALIKTLQNRELDPRVRNGAVYGLCVSKDRKAVGPLIDAIQDAALKKHSDLAEGTLKELTGQDFRWARQWRKWKESQAREEP